MARLQNNLAVILLLSASLLLSGCHQSAVQEEFVTQQATVLTLVQKVVANGTVNPLETIQVGAQVSGLIQEILVDYNSPVRRGQVIARIDPTLYAAKVEQARSTLTLAQAELEKAGTNLDLARTQFRRYEALAAQNLIAHMELDHQRALYDSARADFQAAHQRIQGQSRFVEPSFNQGLWRTYRGGPDRDTPDVDTGVELDRLKQLLRKMCAVPEGFEVHHKVKRLFETRLAMADEKQPLDWATAELLAFATLLADGYSVRLTGQDTERGTFSQRHAVLHDVRTGATWTPLQHLSDVQGNCTVLNSPLSELGCVGFEFGYSLDYPDALVAWEAQFGDFVNGAQIIIDQFISSSEDKWRRLSGLVLLLPHGYEGQGPEHSSARLERFLGLCAEDNMQVVNPASPAQYFHVLRRQVVRPWRKPLVVMTPKSLLRRPECVSPLSELASGRFQRFVPDRADVELAHVDRLLLCSGKVYWDLLAGRDAAKDGRIAIARVAQLYPLPFEAMKEYLRKMPSLREVFWVQEEPKNMGAWKYMIQPLQQLLADHPNKPRYGYIGRVESASPATGFHDTHVYEQKLIVEEAFRRS